MKIDKFIWVLAATILIITMVYSILINSASQKVYTVNLGKILSAQMLMAGRMAQIGDKKSLWMATVNDSSNKVRETIHEIAGDHLVIVTPAVIQGGTDITNRVLKKLGLPTNIPHLSIKQKDIMPQFLPNKPKALTRKKGAPLWQLP